jgi:hypothetical protein
VLNVIYAKCYVIFVLQSVVKLNVVVASVVFLNVVAPSWTSHGACTIKLFTAVIVAVS